MVFFMLMKNSCTLGLFFEMTIDTPITKTTIKIPIADRATPSRLLKTSLFVIASRRSVEAICFLSSDDTLMIPAMELMTRSTLAG